MPNNSSLRITELDFDSIRENLKTYLRNQDEFTDFDFEGSGMAVLLDILAYNTHYMAYQLNMVGNEMFLDSARLRSSVLSHAKMIGYVPTSKQGAINKINIIATPSNTEDQNVTSITLDKYTRLLGADIDGVNYPFVTMYSNNSVKSSGSFEFNDILIKQGEVVSLQYPVNSSRTYTIPSSNVDVSTVQIRVQESTSNTDTEYYTQSRDITELTPTSAVYFIEENESLNYNFYFGDGVLGKKPKDGNIIICTYVDTVGEGANGIGRFSFSEPIGGYFSDNVSITTSSGSYGGTDKESIEQTQFRAPYFYTTQNRAVVSNDFETLLLKEYNYIDSVNVWGGEDHDPITYGKVFISIKTKGNYALTVLEKERLKNDLIKTRSVMTVTPEIIDPDYIYLMISGKVWYNPNLTGLSSNEILELVRAAILEYSENELGNFGAVFRKSRLLDYIEVADKSIEASDIDIQIQKRTLLNLTRSSTYEIDFSLPIKKGAVVEKLSSFPDLEVIDGIGISRRAYLEEVPEYPTGIDNVILTSPGKRYLSAPTVTIRGDGSGATARARVVSGRIESIELLTPGKDYTRALVIISGGGGSGGSATATLQSSKGRLRLFYYKEGTGQKVIINENAGTVDYSYGKILINQVRIFQAYENEFYDEGILTISAPIEEDLIETIRNRIIVLDSADPRSINITVAAR